MSVYIIQRQMRWDDREEEWKPQFNMEPAKQYGELVYLLGPKATPFDRKVINQLENNLTDFGEGDYLLLTGNPCLIGIASAIAARNNKGQLKFLQWSGKFDKYLEVKAHI